MPVQWTKYYVEIQFVERVVGPIPVADEEEREKAYRSWLKAQGLAEPAIVPLAKELAEDPDMPTAELAHTRALTSFKRDDAGPYMEARAIKAMLKEAAQRLGIVKTIRGSRQVLQHDLLVLSEQDDQKIHFKLEPGHEQLVTDHRPISVITPQGPRAAFKSFEYLWRPQLDFSIRVLAGGVGNGLLGYDELHDMLEFGQTLGLGADRSQGEGVFEIVEFSEEMLVKDITSIELPA